MIIGFDHAPVVVRDLDAAARRLTALFGRSPSWIGRLDGARHAWFQLANIAIEVIAADGEGSTGENVRRWFEAAGGEGPSAIGFATPALDEARRMLARRGVAVAPPEESRSVDQHGRERTWRYAMADATATRGVQLFLTDRAEPSPWPVSPAMADEAAVVAAVDHVVIRTANPEAAIALYGAKLDLDLRLDRSNPDWGSRLLFFRCGDAIVEVGASLSAPVSDAPDRLGGFAWRVPEPEAAHARIGAAGLDVSELRKGRKPGTSVFTVRDAIGGPNLIISASTAAED